MNLEEMGYEHHHLTRLRAELALRAERPKDADRLYLKALEQFIDSSKGVISLANQSPSGRNVEGSGSPRDPSSVREPRIGSHRARV